MPMPPYPIYCSTKDCKNLAAFKIAARWSDGLESELKTYGLVCGDCLPNEFSRSLEKRKQCRLTAGETLELPGIFKLEHGQRDKKLLRLDDVERQLLERIGVNTNSETA